MTRAPVTSTDIASIGYDADTLDLTIEFRRGSRLYVYLLVPPDVFAGLHDAKSVGAFFNREIKGKYEFKEVKA